MVRLKRREKRGEQFPLLAKESFSSARLRGGITAAIYYSRYFSR